MWCSSACHRSKARHLQARATIGTQYGIIKVLITCHLCWSLSSSWASLAHFTSAQPVVRRHVAQVVIVTLAHMLTLSRLTIVARLVETAAISVGGVAKVLNVHSVSAPLPQRANVTIVIVGIAEVGLNMVMVAITAWLQKSVARYFQLKELRQLTGEYVVQDLSLQQISPQQAERDMEAGPAQMGMPEPTPSAPPVSFGPVTAQTVQMSLTRDLQAVYGYGM